MYLDREERKRVEQREREMKELVEHVLNYHWVVSSLWHSCE
jgi:hypothetical protein